MASIYKESSEECLGFMQRGKRNEWITTDTWKAIDNRRTLQKKLIDAKSERLCDRYQQQNNEAD